MASNATTVEEQRAALLEQTQAAVDAENKTRSGKGTRLRVGQTRGKNPQVIKWEAFDASQPETLPVSVSEFMELAKPVLGHEVTEPEMVSFLVDGFNDSQYTAASDPIAEYVDASWPDDIQRNFRTVVRNYVSATKTSIEDAVALIKPGIVKALSK